MAHKRRAQRQAKPSNPFVQLIVQHWKANFPWEAGSLAKVNQLLPAAEKAAELASRAHEQALSNGLSWTQAEELSADLWGTPPNLN